MIELFAYGTLRDPEFQAALFGSVPPMRAATLAGWMPVFTESGYLTIVEAPGETVTGDLVELDAETLLIADAWEEVPLYVRTPVNVEADGVPVTAWVYVRPSASRDRAPDGVLSLHPREDVLAAILSFRAEPRNGRNPD